MVLKVCSYVRALCRLCVPNVLNGRVGYDVDASHVFLQGVLAALTLIESENRDGGVTASTRCEAGLSLCSVVVTTLSGVGFDPKFLSRSPVAHAQVGPIPFECVFFPLPTQRLFPQRWGELKQAGCVHIQRSNTLPVYVSVGPLRCHSLSSPFPSHVCPISSGTD